ncbi:MAG TPA: AarF/ABC1/UbiB kinase family protein [Pyrinomonadaceae bacterium]|nr:AarF/ABC1/UbiB kinase family protein [Pyrinomonadaceae bacterium]
MSTSRALVPVNTSSHRAAVSRNGDGASAATTKAPAQVPPLTEELVDKILKGRGLRGWWRVARVSRVLGLFTLYLFLDTYHIRSSFNQRMAERRSADSEARGFYARFITTARHVFGRMFDQTIRLLRLIVFRGAEGSDKKAARLEKQAVWLRDSLIDLGPTFIKIGQALGTRADLLPLAYVKELSTLQDQVPAYSTSDAFARIEAELGRPVHECFVEIDSEPIASASLGQVYRARLASGEEVAVKVQRPHLDEIISFDIAVLYRIVQLINRFFPRANENADWEGMLREFYVTIFDEVDYVKEGRNADRFRYNFRTWRAVRVPKIFWSHTSRRVLTLEFIRGTKVTDLDALRARRISPVKVNRLLVRTYLKQLLEDGFFHADPHPGNLLVMDSGHLAFFDFGMVGRITPQLQSQMIDAFFHVVSKDVQGLGQDIINLNFLKPGVNPETIRPVVESLFTLYLNLKLGEVKFKELTYDLAEVVYEYPFRLPANFTYVMRALMTLEGIGIVTDPGFSFFETAKPYAREFMLKREGKVFRRLIFDKMTGREDGTGRIEWARVWKLTKMAAQMYLDG